MQHFPYEETAAALANLATATAADRQTMSHLTSTIDNLTKQLAARDVEIATLKATKNYTTKKPRAENGEYC